MNSRWADVEVRAFLNLHRPDLRVAGVKTLAGGYWNDVLRLDTDQGQMVLKHYRAVMPGTLFPNLPQDEACALTRLSGAKVAPDPVGYWPEDKVLIYHYVEGEVWNGDLAAMAALLRRKSSANAEGFRSVPVTPVAILIEGDALFAQCQDDSLTLRLRSARPDVSAPPPSGWCPKRQLCHTDIGATNLIGTGDGLRLIDWQCPAAGDVAEDVFSFLSPAFQILNMRQPLSTDDRAHFLDLMEDAALSARYAALEPAYAWRMAGYCCRRMQTADEPEVRERYARAALAGADLIEGLTC
jgi:thiamine kinase